MKKSSKRFTTLTALVLTSVLFLGACGDNKKESTSMSSSSKVSQKVKSSTSSSSKEKAKKSERKTKSSSSEEVTKAASGEKDSQTPAENVAGTAQQEVAPTNPTEGTAVVNQGATTEQPATPATPATPAAPAEQASTTTAVDTTAIANGDFSSVAGTYQNDLGDTIMVSPSGSVTRVTAEDGYSDTSSQLHNGFAQDGGYVAGFAHNDGPTSDPIFFDSNGQVRFGSDAIYGRMHVYNKLD